MGTGLLAAPFRTRWARACRRALALTACLLLAGSVAGTPRAAAGTGAPTIGYRFPGGGFMGTYTVNGRPTFCIDLNGLGPSTAGGYTAGPGTAVRRQLGWNAAHRGGNAGSIQGTWLTAGELGRLAYLTDRYAATTSPVTAAAAEHAVRSLTVGDAAQTAREAVRWAEALQAHPAVRPAYDAIQADVAGHAGPYRLSATWTTAPTAIAPGVLAVQVLSAAGVPMPGIALGARYSAAAGGRAVTATTGGTGTARLTVTATAPGTVTVDVTARNLPAAVPLLYVPRRYADPRTPDHSAQRTVGPAPRVALAASVTADVAAAVPVLTTQASAATTLGPSGGAALTDAVTVSGTIPGARGTATASLWGPFDARPTADRCAAPTLPVATTTFAVTGDGTSTTPALTVTAPGYYAWTETLPGTALQAAVSTACGVDAETTLVQGTPAITLATAASVAPGDDVTATLTASQLFPGASPTATVYLYGPFATAPGASACTAGTMIDQETVTLAADGSYPVGPVTVPGVGHYSWTLAVPAGPQQPAVAPVCGAAPGAFTATRPDLGALQVTNTSTAGATGPVATLIPGGPELAIPSVGIAAPLVAVGRSGTGIAVPSDVALAGELDAGASAGEPAGTVVVAGRVGTAAGAPGALAPLAGVVPGDVITLTDVHGTVQRFAVSTVTTYPRTQDLPASLFTQGTPLRLVVISATTVLHYGAGLITHRDNLVVVATPI